MNHIDHTGVQDMQVHNGLLRDDGIQGNIWGTKTKISGTTSAYVKKQQLAATNVTKNKHIIFILYKSCTYF